MLRVKDGIEFSIGVILVREIWRLLKREMKRYRIQPKRN